MHKYQILKDRLSIVRRYPVDIWYFLEFRVSSAASCPDADGTDTRGRRKRFFVGKGKNYVILYSACLQTNVRDVLLE